MYSEEKQFNIEMKRRLAQVAIGPSSLRNQGKPGVIEICRDFCEDIDLNKYTPADFESQLDHDTRKLLEKLEMTEESWGTARKAINLFLRDVFYNKYLSKVYNMDNVEHLLEIPLDQQVADRILEKKPDSKLKWKGIINTNKIDNIRFQEKAKEIASEINYIKHRVHLDLEFWRSGESKSKNN